MRVSGIGRVQLAICVAAGLWDLAEASGLGVRLMGGAFAAADTFVVFAVLLYADAPRGRRDTPALLLPVAALVSLVTALGIGLRLSSDFAAQPRLLIVGLATGIATIAAASAVGVEGKDLIRPSTRRTRTSRRETYTGPVATLGAAVIALPLTWYSVHGSRTMTRRRDTTLTPTTGSPA